MNITNFEDGEHFFWFAKENRVNCQEIGYLARKIAKDYQANTGKSPKYIEHIICNCYMAWLYRQAVAYFSKNEHWTGYNAKIKDRSAKFSVISFRAELRYLEAHQYIVTLKGKKCDWDKHLSMASRMVPAALLEAEFDIAWETAIEYTSDTIKFKRCKGSESLSLTQVQGSTNIPEPTDAVYKRMAFLDMYNNYLRGQYCTYNGVITNYLWDSENKCSVRLNRAGDVRFVPQLTANYCGDWESGGRLYARSVFGMVDYQQLNKRERATIKINGENTVEVDYSCLHLSLLYALDGKQLKGDAYGWHTDRKLAKMVTIIAVNTYNKAHAAIAVSNWCADNDYSIDLAESLRLVEQMLAYHAPIADRLFHVYKAVKALTLQHHDSTIVCNVLKQLHKRNIPALPVHDSVIVPEKYRNTAIRIMKEQYKQVTGFEIEVK